MNTPNWLRIKCNKLISEEKRIAWNIEGPEPDRYFGCMDCDARIQKKCANFDWASWVNAEDLAWELSLKEE